MEAVTSTALSMGVQAQVRKTGPRPDTKGGEETGRFTWIWEAPGKMRDAPIVLATASAATKQIHCEV